MVEGTFSFLLFLFSSPQQAIVNQFEGYWLVAIDNTEQARDWNRIYFFESCSKMKREAMECDGHYGWAEFDGIYSNFYDKSYTTFGVDRDIDVSTGKRRVLLSGNYYDFVLNTGKKTLRLFDPDSGGLIMEMTKVKKSVVRRSEKGIN